tara:strand:+ start:149 stop:487 length:339 start_codon:yes stop_codon:yes gene_type:complete
MSRYNSYRILNNSNEYYRKLRQERNNVKNIRQYETPILRHPTITERAAIESTQHIWTVGDRFYKLAQKYYNDPTLWWVIAWYNGTPTEADVYGGYLLTIPINVEKVIETFGI